MKKSRSVFFLGSFLCALLAACASGICHTIKHPELAASAGAATAANTNMCSAGTSGAPTNPANCDQPIDQVSTSNDIVSSQTGTNPTGSFGPGVTNNSTNNNSLTGVHVPGDSSPKTVLVYKPDGSLQCNMGHTISNEEMEKQLSGIRVLSSKRQTDGKMHMQLCGSPTGYINVYEIPESSLSEAQLRGFKKL